MSSKRSSSSSVAIIESNDDLLTEILVLLPAESLTRFKVVSKRWRSLISAYWFWFRHHRRETQPSFILSDNGTNFFIICKPGGRTPLPCQFRSRISCPRVRSVQVVQSCNGLLLLRCLLESGIRYYVFNPTTLQRRNLAPLPDHSRIRSGRVFLMFDPSASPHYRVVYFAKHIMYKDHIYEIYTYSSETHRWKLTNDRIHRYLNFRNGIYFKGGICFLRGSSHSGSSLIIRNAVVRNIRNPPQLHYPGCWEKQYANESNGVLFWSTLYWGNGNDTNNILHVWEMKEIENGWSDKYKVDMKPIMATFGASSCRGIKVVGIMFGGEKEKDPCLMLSFPGNKVVIYRFCDGVCEVVVEYSTAPHFQMKMDLDVHHFTQNIVPL